MKFFDSLKNEENLKNFKKWLVSTALALSFTGLGS
jgi:hypothetical protein